MPCFWSPAWVADSPKQGLGLGPGEPVLFAAGVAGASSVGAEAALWVQGTEAGVGLSGVSGFEMVGGEELGVEAGGALGLRLDAEEGFSLDMDLEVGAMELGQGPGEWVGSWDCAGVQTGV